LHTQSKFRLLVVRLGAMGDILHALPAVTALRQAHPGWVIDWVVEPRWRALLTAENPAAGQAPKGHSSGATSQSRQPNPARPIVNRIHLAATRDWRDSPLGGKTLHEIISLRQALKSGGYDVVLDLQGAIRSAVVGRMAGSRRVIGEAEPRERAARWLFTEQVETHGAHVIEQGVELASAVAGDDLQPATPWLPVDPTSEAWADRILPRDDAQQTVLINPGAGWGAKRWPVERHAAVAQGLIDRGLRVLVNAGPREEPLAEAIVRSVNRATPVHCSLEQLIALTRRVTLAIAGDTGPLHLACALGRPVVGIYGPTDPDRNGPFGTRFKVLRSPESRRDHTRHAAPEAGMMTIQAEDVLRAADELLAQENAG
jgi:heptosyltransferase I